MMSMTGRTRTVSLVEGLTLASVLVFLTSGISLAQSKTIIDEWAAVQAPKPPELKPVTLDPKTTALLVLDFVKQTCNTERRPRCLDSVPKVQALLKQARAKGVTVIHSTTTAATPADIAKELTPLEGEPIVKAPADKFFKTVLEKILSEKGIKTVANAPGVGQQVTLTKIDMIK
jgi:Isochorismatase family